MKNQKGITFPALIVTVIIMLILAGLTIWMAKRQDELVKEVENTVQNVQNSVENVQLKVNEQGDAINAIEDRLEALQGGNTIVGE